MPLEAEWEREMKGKKKKKKITWNFCINGLVTILINWISFFLGNHLGSCSICHLRRWKIGDIYHWLLSSICWSFGGAGFYIHPNSWMCMLTAEQPSVLWWISPDSKAKKKKKNWCTVAWCGTLVTCKKLSIITAFRPDQSKGYGIRW